MPFPTSTAPTETTAAPEQTSAETPPTQAELLEYVRAKAADAELIASLPLDPHGRTWLRLNGPGGSEAWIIGWPPGTGTGWHDHGGSYGAFATAAGELTEDSLAAQLPVDGWTTLDVPVSADRRKELSEGRSRSFGPHHLHDVLNRTEDTHAISVHAYYPPLPLMRQYTRTGSELRFEGIERPGEWE